MKKLGQFASTMPVALLLFAVFELFLMSSAHAVRPGATPVNTASVEDLLPAEDAFKISARFKDAGTIELNYQIADGYYLYRKRFKVANKASNPTPEFKIGALKSPPGRVKQDATFGRVETYRRSVRLLLPIAMLNKDTSAGERVDGVKLQIISQGCADVGVCYPPLTHELSLRAGSGDIVVPAVVSSAGAVLAVPATSTAPSTSAPGAIPTAPPGIADLVKKVP